MHNLTTLKADPRNAGLIMDGLPIVAPYKDPTTGRWTMAVVSGDLITGDSFTDTRVLVVRADGQATPATVVPHTEHGWSWSNAGNLLIGIKRDAIPADLKAIRAEADAAAKAAYKANGGKAGKAPKTSRPLPIPGGQAPVTEQAPTAPDDEYQQYLIWKAAQAQATKAPTSNLPTRPPKGTK